MQEEALVAKQQLKELKERWQEKKADFKRSDAVAAMNAHLLKEVKVERDAVTQMKAGLCQSKQCFCSLKQQMKLHNFCLS